MGKFTTGQNKPEGSGRKKGTPNLKTLILRESLERVGFDIVQEIKELYPSLDMLTKAKVLMGFLPYLFPRPEAVQLTDLNTQEMAVEADPLAGLLQTTKFQDLNTDSKIFGD